MAMAMSRPRAEGSRRIGSAARVGLAIAFALGAAPPAAPAPDPPAARLEIRHPGRGHEVHVSGSALAIAPDSPVVAWFAEAEHATHLYVARPGRPDGAPVRVNPEGLAVAAAHQPPGLASGPRGEIYVSWSSASGRRDALLAGSPPDAVARRRPDLRRASAAERGSTRARTRSRGWRPASSGRVVVSWIESREGSEQVVTRAAVVADRGGRIERVTRVGEDVCVCCRVGVAAGPGDAVALFWRRVFPGNLRDMVFALSRDGGSSFGDAALVHPDRWRIDACPHRGGVVGFDGRGRIHVAWYTEGPEEPAGSPVRHLERRTPVLASGPPA